MMDKIDDEELLSQIQQGDRDAFACLVKRHSQRFYRLAYVMTYQTEIAQDIVQDAFLKLWEKPYLWNAGQQAKFSTWFYRVILNLCYDYHKKTKEILDNQAAQQLFESKIPEVNLAAIEKQQYLKRIMYGLPAKQREALNLTYFEGLKQSQAAEIIGISIAALQSLLTRAKQNLAKKMVEGGYDG